jgi:hypothetical protein
MYTLQQMLSQGGGCVGQSLILYKEVADKKNYIFPS